jgi:hypothetical protein
LFAGLFLGIGAVASTGTRTAAAPVFAVVAFVVAALLALIAWGVLHSVRLDRSERRVDEVIEAAVAGHGARVCDCGHEHDPDELHVTDACAHDGTGNACAHDCQTCVLAAMHRSASDRAQPGRH